MRAVSHKSGESGIVLLTTLLILMMISALMVGFYAAVNADVRSGAIDRDQTQAYAAAHAGLEKLTSDLAQLFQADFSPAATEITDMAANPPTIPGFEYRAPGGAAGSGYNVAFSRTDADGNPAPESTTGSNITSGPYKGLKGIITKYPITITARSITGNAEVRLRREIQTVAVPVFQFGVFSETDLTFYAGDDFNFGGRVHTNGNLFMSNFTNSLNFTDYITAVREVVRSHFSNGLSVSSYGAGYNVMVPTAIGTTTRNLAVGEGSVNTYPYTILPSGATLNTHKWTGWKSLVTGTYKNILRNYENGATNLSLPLVSAGATPIDLIRRAPEDEDADNPTVYSQRFYSQASLRILLSDRVSDIEDLPEVTADAPVPLDWAAGVPAGYVIGAGRPPIAQSPGYLAGTAITGLTSGLNVAVFPDAYKLPRLTVDGQTNIFCSGKTHNTFTGCGAVGTGTPGSPLVAIGSGGKIVSAVITEGLHSKTVTATTVGGVSAGTNSVITVGTDQTAAFSKRTFWIHGVEASPTAPASNLATCKGYTDLGAVHRFTTCTYLPAVGSAAPAVGHIITNNAVVAAGTSLIGGFIKIEKQDAAGVWTDVTMDILNLGFAAPSQDPSSGACGDPTPNAVIRIQRLRDEATGPCTYTGSTNPYDYWPNVLYDTREGSYRGVSTTAPITAGGVMGYIALDVANLTRWLSGAIGATGSDVWDNNGYVVYFSDRRGNHNEDDATTPDVETGEYGFEDIVNPTVATGIPNGVFEGGVSGGENANELSNPPNTVMDRYGEDPTTTVAGVTPGLPVGLTQSPYDLNSRPWTQFNRVASVMGNVGMAYVNKPVLFRRALKLINGGITSGTTTNMPLTGLTVASENPVYVQGNYNATSTASNAEPNVPAAILADAVMLLSNAWTDVKSLRSPNDVTQRDAANTSYRFAVLAGKSKSFTYPTVGSPQFLFGTDGGVGNFLRLLEDWQSASQVIRYRGSIVSLFHSRQATGTFKYGGNVYDFGTREFKFDDDFLLPALLPPGTPMFRDVNTLTFRQILRPGE